MPGNGKRVEKEGNLKIAGVSKKLLFPAVANVILHEI
jgi:hypothetical protein